MKYCQYKQQKAKKIPILSTLMTVLCKVIPECAAYKHLGVKPYIKNFQHCHDIKSISSVTSEILRLH